MIRSNPRVEPAAWAEASAQLIGASSAHQALLAQLRCVAASDAPLLIEGETGSGKEVAARAVHYGGTRRAGPFVAVNCGALPEGLIESELFGVRRGAYTDARESRRGLVAEACHGTLFLDEVDALSPKAQVSLLRFLQDQRYRPVGTTHDLRTDARIVAAANRPLDELVDARTFRADLLYRLKILHLVLPPLRSRGADVELLARHFVDRLCARYGTPQRDIHPDTLRWLRRHSWPGNVRELENWVHRRFLMSPGPSITHEGVEVDGGGGEAEAVADDSPLPNFQRAKADAVRRFERVYLLRALREAGGNVTRAARIAGKERRAFGKLLKKHGIERSAANSPAD